MSNKNLKVKLTIDADGNVKGVLTGVNGQLGKLKDKTHDADVETNKLTQTVKRFGHIAIGAFAVSKVISYAQATITVADSYKSMIGQLDLVTDSNYELLSVQYALHDIAVETRGDISDLTKLYSSLSPTFKQMGKSMDESIGLIEIYNKALSLTSPNAQQSAAATLQFAQAMGSGVMRGDEFNSMMENGRGVMMTLADGLRVPIGALREMAEAGELTADVVVTALQRQSDVVDDKFKKIPVTVGSAMRVANTETMLWVGSLDEATNATESLAEGIIYTSQHLNEMTYLVGVGLFGAITAKTIPALYGMATATTVASTAGKGFIATTRAMTVAALAFAMTPIGAAMTAVAAGVVYLALKEDETEVATRDLTESLREQNIEMNKSQIKIKAQELAEYRDQLQHLIALKNQNGAVDVFDVKENLLQRRIGELLAGIHSVSQVTIGDIGLDLEGEVQAQIAILDALENRVPR